MNATTDIVSMHLHYRLALLDSVLLVQQKPIWLILPGHECFSLGFACDFEYVCEILSHDVRVWTVVLLLGISLHFPLFSTLVVAHNEVLFQHVCVQMLNKND